MQSVCVCNLKMLGDTDDARDVAQESFIKVWDRIDTYKSEFKFTTWLYKIVMNTCLDRLRKRAKYNTVFKQLDNQNNQYATFSSDPSTEFEEKQLVDFVRILSSRLSHKQHSVFVLHDLEEFSQDEISKILNMPKGGVKSNLYYARKAVRQSLMSFDHKKIITKHDL